MEYGITYGVEVTGTILIGPRAGRTVDRARSDSPTLQNAQQAADYARANAVNVSGSIRPYAKQWFDKAPEVIPVGAEWMPTKRGGPGGFLLTYIGA